MHTEPHWLHHFWRDRRGGFSIPFALSLVAIVMTLGIGADMARLVIAQQRAQGIADTFARLYFTIPAAERPHILIYMRSAQRAAEAMLGTLGTPFIGISGNGSYLRFHGMVMVTPIFIRLVGVNTIYAGVESEARPTSSQPGAPPRLIR